MQIAIAVFLLTIAIIFVYRKIALKLNIFGKDINKLDQPIVPESGGIALIDSLIVASIVLVFFNIIVLDSIMVWLIVSILLGIVGILDDTKNKFLSSSMSWGSRALPIALISLLGAYLYTGSLDILAIAVTALFIAGLASFQNTFAGLNGWEIGSGFILSLVVLFTLVNTPYYLLGVIFSSGIFALLIFNIYPARLFPGDSGTLFIGAGIAGLLTLTNNLVFGFLLFIPHIIDYFILKIGTNKGDVSQQKIRPYKILPDGRLTIPDYPDGKIKYDFAKLIIKILGPLKEWQIVLVIWTVVIVNSLIWLFFFGFF